MLFITYDFPPSAMPGASSCAEIVRYLPLYGWEPTVLTVKERFYETVDARRQPPVPVVRTSALPHPFEIYGRVRSLFSSQRHSARATTRAPDERIDRRQVRHGAWHLRDRMWALLGTPDLYTGWIPAATIAGLRACREFDVACLVSSGPWWSNHLVGLIIARLTRLPWIAHFRDPWIGQASSPTGNALAWRLSARLERKVVARADHVICVTDRHAESLRRTYSDQRRDKFSTVPNGYDEAPWEGLVLDELDQTAIGTEKFVITYAGAICDERDPSPLFHAVRRLIDCGELDPATLQFVFIGWCETVRGRRIEDIAADNKLDGCLHVGGVLTKAETFRWLSKSALLLLLAEGLTLQVPSKAYEYLRSGRPILAFAPRTGAVADLLTQTGGAWVVEPRDETGIVAAVREAYRGWSVGRAAKRPDQAVVHRFDRTRLARQFADVLELAVAGRAG